jgi:geranylgeranylglycerol-phosphate geranylgeranyltransferase
MRQLVPTLFLIRPLNCVLAACGVLVGAYLTLAPVHWMPVSIAAVSAFLVCAGGNVFNDLKDIGLDRIAHSKRALASGELTGSYAFRFGLFVNLVTIILSLLVNLLVATVVATTIVLLAVYNYWLKRLPLLGNLVVAVCAGTTFMVGGLASSTHEALALPGPLIPAIFAVLLHLMRELVKDVQDLEGDKSVGIRTLPMVIGVRATFALVFVLALSLAVATYWPYAYEWFGYQYFWLAGGGVVAPTLSLSVIAMVLPATKVARVFSGVLKVAMGVGLLALIVA